jgi:hypothetical protein
MIIAIYATLGVLMLLAARNPEQHVSLISFVIWSSIVHGATMAVQSVANTEHLGHLYGDVPALFLVAAVFGWLSPGAYFQIRQRLTVSSRGPFSRNNLPI